MPNSLLEAINAIFGNRSDSPSVYPPVAFYFKVSFPGSSEINDTSFKEVSGISIEIETEAIEEGGENRFVHQLPKRAKHGNLVLKRGLTTSSSELFKWVKENIEGDYSALFTTKSIQIDLLGANGDSLNSWICANAYPVKWEIDSFDSTKNDVVIETIEFAYTTLNRTK
jgi:phage tail-like protein